MTFAPPSIQAEAPAGSDGASARPSPDTPCVHCGLPVGSAPVGNDPTFCCSGCEVVYHALHESGLGDTYYRLSDVARERDPVPARTSIDPLVLSELDTASFLEEHTALQEDGTRRTELFLDGVHCAACVWLVERLPQEMDGVLATTLDLPRARLSLHWDPTARDLSEIAEWLLQFGYVVHPVRQDSSEGRTEGERALLVKVGVTWALAGNVMLLALAFYAGLDVSGDPGLATAARWLSMLLASVSVAYGGSEFIRRAWASLRLTARTRSIRSLHMDTPIALGILVGYADSAWATVTGTGEVWFDSITVLIAALLTARWMQLRSRRLAGDATDRLLSLIPSMVRRIGPDGALETVRMDEVHRGDLVRVPTGEVIPVDGVVATGESTVNNAVLTGESRPERVRAGSDVSAGATNLSGPLDVLVQAAGSDSRVGRLLDWIRDSDGANARVASLADRLTGYFVSGVAVLALATALIWWWIEPSTVATHVVALLVITCPCALGMATPLALAVAAGKAARAGIFLKNESATQALTEVDAVVLDKTGTLTEGRLSLVETVGDDRTIDLAAALEAHSTHPIADALVRARSTCPLDPDRPDAASDSPTATVDDVEAVHGQGIRGRVDGCDVAIGRPDWVRTLTTDWPADLDRFADFAQQGHTPVAVAVDGRPAAALAFGDAIRPDSADILRMLHEAGTDVYLLSGDHPRVAAAVARTLGIRPDRVRGHVLPEDKRDVVERLQEDGRIVAMIGDGVNDAAALQAADVGVAVEGGSTASLVAADVFLTRDGLGAVADLFEGAGRVMRVIRRNLGFSLLYNVAAAAAAMSGLVGPLVAAIAMPLSSLVVVTSSISQRSFSTDSPAPRSDSTPVGAPPSRPAYQPAPSS